MTDGEHAYYAVVFEGLIGEELEVDTLDESTFRVWGRRLGLLHTASTTFPHHPARPIWQAEIHFALDTLPPEESKVRQVMEAGLAWMDTLPVQNFGLIHGDFEMDNLIWDGEQFQVLDFDGAVYSWFAADIAIALQDVWGDAERDTKIGWFLEEYGETAPVPDKLFTAIPRFLSIMLAHKIAGLLRSYATTTADHQPDWLMQMKGDHNKWLETRRAMLIWEFV